MNVLVLNTGSSSLKYQLFDMQDVVSLASGIVERIGEGTSRHHLLTTDVELTRDQPVRDHRAAMDAMAALLGEAGAVSELGHLFGVGHRVVHGGQAFAPTLINAAVLATIRRQIPLAPLHNPGNIVGIEEALQRCPNVPQVAVFDTAFHQTLPPHAYHYALPFDLCAAQQIRRYGFHGTSHFYVAKQAARWLQQPLQQLNLIVLHLGNGASAAIRGGQSVDTSMGMTPLEGLMMGTRCGDVDPAVVLLLARTADLSVEEVDSMLNHDSGLKGVCGVNDMRQVLARAGSGDARAALAVEMYAYRVKKYIGAYRAVLGHVDAVVFTAGIGEHAPAIRARACSGMSELGIAVDEQANQAATPGVREIQAADSRLKVLVVPTDEELEIARQTVDCIGGGGANHER